MLFYPIIKSGIGARIRYRRVFLLRHHKSGIQSAYIRGQAVFIMALMEMCIHTEQLSKGCFLNVFRK